MLTRRELGCWRSPFAHALFPADVAMVLLQQPDTRLKPIVLRIPHLHALFKCQGLASLLVLVPLQQRGRVHLRHREVSSFQEVLMDVIHPFVQSFVVSTRTGFNFFLFNLNLLISASHFEGRKSTFTRRQTKPNGTLCNSS